MYLSGFVCVSPALLLLCACPWTSGHPSCLDMSEELVSMIQTYRWQCMECKTCTVCQQPHHEDEMMFCDMCDRGYHTFCVGMDSIPTGEQMDIQRRFLDQQIPEACTAKHDLGLSQVTFRFNPRFLGLQRKFTSWAECSFFHVFD